MNRALVWIFAVLLAGRIVATWGQEDAIVAPPGEGEVQLWTDAQSEELVAPVALYPDPLLAAVLTAATQPAEVVMAARFVERGGDAASVDDLEWSDSLKALVRYPEVLLWMDENIEWTTEVGKAFLLEPEEVMDAVQRLRARAEALGNLVSTELVRVESEDGVIDILPVDPDFVYLPQYEPAVVFHQPSSASIGPVVTFGGGKRTGVWLRHDWDWTNRRIIAWKKEHTRPRTWWTQTRAVRFQNATVGQHVGEWCPRAVKGQAQGKFWAQRQARTANSAPNAGKGNGSPTASRAQATAGSNVATGKH
jgi:hypothetical protein